MDLPKSDITDLILVPNGNATGNYAIRRIVHDVSPACDLTSDNVFLYYAQNSTQTSGGSITPVNTVSCFSAVGTLTLQNHTCPIHRWELSFNDGAWEPITNITNMYNFSPLSDGTYCYRALIDDVCSGAVGSIDLDSDDYSGQACVEVVSVIFQNNFENLIPRSMSTAAAATVEVIGDVEIRN